MTFYVIQWRGNPNMTQHARNLLGKVETPRHEYDLINIIMICLGDANDEVAEDEAGILRLLEVLLSPKQAFIDKKTI
jgi:hypothetical protein